MARNGSDGSGDLSRGPPREDRPDAGGWQRPSSGPTNKLATFRAAPPSKEDASRIEEHLRAMWDGFSLPHARRVAGAAHGERPGPSPLGASPVATPAGAPAAEPGPAAHVVVEERVPGERITLGAIAHRSRPTELVLFAQELAKVNLLIAAVAQRGFGLSGRGRKVVAGVASLMLGTFFFGFSAMALTGELPFAAAAPEGALQETHMVQPLAAQPGNAPDPVEICHKPGTPAEKNLTLPGVAGDGHDGHDGHGDDAGPCDGGAFDGGGGNGNGTGGRVAVCHFTGNGGSHTIVIAPVGVPAHLEHGDTVGACEGGGNLPPVAAFNFTCDGLACAFDGSASFDPDGTLVAYAWDFAGLGNASSVASAFAFPANGTYGVTLQVTDNDGASAWLALVVTVGSGSGGGGGGSGGGDGGGSGGSGGGGEPGGSGHVPDSGGARQGVATPPTQPPTGRPAVVPPAQPQGPGSGFEAALILFPAGPSLPDLLFIDTPLAAGTSRRSHQEGTLHGEDEDQGEETGEQETEFDSQADLFGDGLGDAAGPAAA